MRIHVTTVFPPVYIEKFVNNYSKFLKLIKKMFYTSVLRFEFFNIVKIYLFLDTRTWLSCL